MSGAATTLDEVVSRVIECVECQPPHKRAPFVAIEVEDYVRARITEALAAKSSR